MKKSENFGVADTLIKASANHKKTSAYMEIELEADTRYIILLDIQNEKFKSTRNYNIVFLSKKSKKITEISKFESQNFYARCLCDLALTQGGKEVMLHSKNKLPRPIITRHIYTSMSLGICIWTYVNHGSWNYDIVEEIEIKGGYSCSKKIRAGKRMDIKLAKKSKRLVIMRFDRDNFSLSLVESCIVRVNKNN